MQLFQRKKERKIHHNHQYSLDASEANYYNIHHAGVVELVDTPS